MAKAPKHRMPGYLYYHKPLVEADNALDAARKAGKDRQCPSKFNAVKAKVDKAYETYMACRTNEAIEMARRATAEAKALCSGKKVVDKMTLRVHFDFDRSEIRPADKAELDKAVDFVKKYPDAEIEIKGHTDSMGSDAYNRGLSKRRADAVKEYLIREADVAPAKIRARGYGESKPVASNDTEEGRAKNRRVEILILSD
jgi:outer membrane protein OmpA-like peptidoglycan-associated protein